MDRVDPWEFLEWVAYYGLEPFGPEADDVRAAQIAAAAMNGPSFTLKRAISAERFLLGSKRAKGRQSVEDMQKIWRGKARS